MVRLEKFRRVLNIRKRLFYFLREIEISLEYLILRETIAEKTKLSIHGVTNRFIAFSRPVRLLKTDH